MQLSDEIFKKNQSSGFFQKKLIDSIPFFENMMNNPFSISTVHSMSLIEIPKKKSSFENGFIRKSSLEEIAPDEIELKLKQEKEIDHYQYGKKL